MKCLTGHGHQQAEDSARYVAQLFASGQVPEQRAMLHSTSRRARETAAHLPAHIPNLEVWNADLLRETDPTKNPLRAEAVFARLFVAPPGGESNTLVIVAHNNMILYLLMRAASLDFEQAAQAWRLFQLRHASVTRIDVLSTGIKQIACIGAAGHITHSHVTWDNITGADMADWKGGEAARRKFKGRMIVLVRQAHAGVDHCGKQIQAVASHIKGLSEYMMSGHVTVTCTSAAEFTGLAIAQQFRVAPQVLPDSISEHPEAGFLSFFSPPTAHTRDAIIMVADDAPLLYWLLRALYFEPDKAKAAASLYNIGHACVSLVNVRPDSTMKVVGVGDQGHVPVDALT